MAEYRPVVIEAGSGDILDFFIVVGGTFMTTKFLMTVFISRKFLAAMNANTYFSVQNSFFVFVKTLLRAVKIMSVIFGFVFASTIHADKFAAMFLCFFTVCPSVKALMS